MELELLKNAHIMVLVFFYSVLSCFFFFFVCLFYLAVNKMITNKINVFDCFNSFRYGFHKFKTMFFIKVIPPSSRDN